VTSAIASPSYPFPPTVWNAVAHNLGCRDLLQRPPDALHVCILAGGVGDLAIADDVVDHDQRPRSVSFIAHVR
jgi:hypothetical protein